MQSRRNDLVRVEPQSSTHAGLWLDRFMPTLGTQDEGTARDRRLLIEQVRSRSVPKEYRQHYRRWKQALEALDPDQVLATAEVHGRMVVGLGAESVLETSITLHRTYGVPVIPGSALKGLASATADRLVADDQWRRAKQAREGAAPTSAGRSHLALFGDTTTAGYVTFHDALWIPGDETSLPLDLDVMTVHHPEYYAGKAQPAADWDSPNPVSFVTARGKYLLAVTGPAEWAERAMALLKLGLQTEGIGAKTAAGYGRMEMPGFKSREEREAQEALAREAQEAREEQTRKEQEARELQKNAERERRIKGLQQFNAANEVEALLKEVSGEERRALALRIEHELRTRFKGWLSKKADKPWVKELLAAAGKSD